jgi:L-ribulose-5-phosphate 3-epimerase
MPDLPMPDNARDSAGPGAGKARPAARWGSAGGAESRRPGMKKSINLWAFPLGQKMSLQQCFELAAEAGFAAVELNFDLEGYLSPATSDSDLVAIGKLARRSGLEISGICTLLQLSYPLTAADPARRAKGLELTGGMIRAAGLLGTENVLVIPGVVSIAWPKDTEPVPNDVCDRRAREAVSKLIPLAEQAGVYLTIENIFANGYLLSPQEMVEFVDSFQHDRVRILFDTGNIMQYQFPEHWIPILGRRIQNVHFKEYNKRTNEFNLESFRTLLDGTTNWPAVMTALDAIDYRGYLTFEYFHPFEHWPEALIYQTSAALDLMLASPVRAER